MTVSWCQLHMSPAVEVYTQLLGTQIYIGRFNLSLMLLKKLYKVLHFVYYKITLSITSSGQCALIDFLITTVKIHPPGYNLIAYDMKPVMDDEMN
jgi:hypothetical protein